MTKDQLLMQIESLEEEAATYRRQGNDTKYNEKMTEANQLRQQMTQLQEVQTAVEQAQSAVVNSLTQIDIGNGEFLSIYDYTTTAEGADLLMAYIQEKIAEITTQATIQSQSYKQELDAAQQKVSEAEDRATIAEAKASAALAESSQKDITIADLEAKRDAAANEIQELQDENKRINQELTDLRDNVVKPPAATNTSANMKELAEKAKAARPKVYNVQWYDEPKRTKYIAKQASNGEDVIFGRLELGKYNVITEEEALQFRNSQPSADEPVQAEPVQETPVQDTPLDNGVIAPPPFLEEGEGSANPVPEENDGAVGGITPVPEVVEEAEPVTRAEFEALKRDVELLKQGQAGAAA